MIMEIVGNGFLARNLKPIAGKHPDTTVFAAGVSWASNTSEAEFAREAALLRQVARDCRSAGRRLLFFSTASAGMYGAVDGPGREDRPVSPGNPYGAHKLSLEDELRASGTDHLILRLGHLIGPDQPAHQFLPTVLRQLREGVVTIHRRAARDLIDVGDVITIIDSLLAQGSRDVTVNVASGTAVPVGLIVDHLEHRLGLTVRREYQDIGDSHVISTEKLQRLVPEVARIGFGPDYYRRILDSFIATQDRASDPQADAKGLLP
jgi:NDP-hexose 4-ketoreductase